MRRSASLLDLRRRCAAARRGIRGVLPVLSSSSPVVDVTLGGALPPRRRRGRASRGGLRGGRRQPRAGRRRGVRGLCCSVARPYSINVRRRRARRSTTSTSSRATSDGLASVARLLYALVALGLAYIRCVENADDLTRHARVSPRWTRRHPGQITHEAGTDHGASRRRRAPGSISSSARRSYSIEPNV